ncbi:hypothetical protein CARUB_v10027771mg [Capsella rubella]|uniref:Ubiquitin-like protease family profile domain-containing protein n=1 Tax=Capsella rubella TaxID=81985 RepID=R0GCZ8_9BRAS|nr:hypothetical protein CARUB_v10027771mg [Capsella rubella]
MTLTIVDKNRRYPPRQYPEGKAPFQKKSMHHNCTLSSFGFRIECIGEEVYIDIQKNSQLAIERRYEIWALIEGSPIRFSLNEYEDITCLNCGLIVEEDAVEVDYREFWDEINVDGKVGLNWTWSAEKRKKIGLLFVVHVGIFGISRSSRNSLGYAKIVMDTGAFERFPWGRVGFKELIQSIKVVSCENNSYAIHGCVHVEVRHVTWRAEDDIYPFWPDELLDNLLHDIFLGRVDAKEWEVGNQNITRSRGPVKLKEVSDESGEETEAPAKVGEEGSLGGVMKLLQSLSGKMDSMNSNFDVQLDNLGNQVKEIEKKVTVLESDVAELKKGKESNSKKKGKEVKNGSCVKIGLHANDKESKTDEGDGSGPNEELWIIEQKQTFEDDFPISCVVRNPSRKSRVSLKEVTSPSTKTKRHPSTAPEKKRSERVIPLKNILISKKFQRGHHSPPLERRIEVKRVRVHDLSNELEDSSFGSELSVTSEVEARKNLGLSLEKLYMFCKTEGDVVPKGRARNLASIQVDPYIDNLVVKRILKGKTLSPAHYDLFEKVSTGMLDKLMQFVDKDLIMTHKALWPKKENKFGWLKDANMCVIVHMFRKRSMQGVSPYRSDQIDFLDPCDLLTNGVYDVLQPTYGHNLKKWVEEVDILYLAHNIKNDHWIALEVNVSKRRVKVYDGICRLSTNEVVFELCKPYTHMIPALIKIIAPTFDHKKKTTTKTFTIYRLRHIPQNYQQGDCGVYAVKYIECLAI